MGRVAMEHPDGRRVGVDEAAANDPEANPFNRSRLEIDWNDVNQTVITRTIDARPDVDWVGLADEGFVIVADILDQDRLDPTTHEVIAAAGAEIPR